MYTTIKIIHIASVILSFTGFFMRGIWMIQGSELFKAKLVKVAPHFIDTLLLLSAITLSVLSQQYPVTNNWLSLKVVGLLLYIGLGLWAFRFGKNKTQRVIAWLSSLIVFALIVFIALTKPL